jgi:hypothetical protein
LPFGKNWDKILSSARQGSKDGFLKICFYAPSPQALEEILADFKKRLASHIVEY